MHVIYKALYASFLTYFVLFPSEFKDALDFVKMFPSKHRPERTSCKGTCDTSSFKRKKNHSPRKIKTVNPHNDSDGFSIASKIPNDLINNDKSSSASLESR